MARFVTEPALRWSDMDSFGHVNNNQYMVLLEEARVAMMFTVAAEAGLPGFREGVVVARHEIDYILPVTVPADVRVEIRTEEPGNASFALAYEVFADGKLCARARSVLVPYDTAEGRPRRLTEPERAFLRRWQD
ncbi:acyl-CoA thioesterase [Glycomyces xiaoerkulensis]|uniref:acyl-CoA thioesterase n=1 Tax=Glycomyces xiaoerkulensis TaxID=2038139 RepID=UPI000C263031|nr:thioesterase family protein [Glycomyces xiaoerkulensis]